MPAQAFGTLYLLANWFGHIGFMTFFGFVIFILPLCYWLTTPESCGQRVYYCSCGASTLAFDALLFNRLHISFHADLLRSEARNNGDRKWQQWAFLFLLFIVWLGFQLVLANAIWKRVERFTAIKWASLLLHFLSCFVTSHAITWVISCINYHQQDNMFPLSFLRLLKRLCRVMACLT